MGQISKLAPADAKRFEQLEELCIKHRDTFYQVGFALGEIKARKFYLTKNFDTFEAYCESIGFSRRYCNQLILDANIVKELPLQLRKLINSHGAARELGKVAPPLRAAVAHEATQEGTKPATLASVRKSSPPPRKTPPAKLAGPPPRKTPPPSKPKGPKDETGIEIPKEILPLWERGSEVNELLVYAQSIRNRLKKAEDSSDPLYAELDFSSIKSSLNQLIADIRTAKPYAVCPSCSGVATKDCIPCKGRGIVSEFFWNTCVPEETRKLRKG